MNIDLVLSKVDDDVMELLTLLPFPIKSLIKDIQSGFIGIYKIMAEDQCLGLTVFKVSTDYNGQKELVVMHNVRAGACKSRFFEIQALSEIEMARAWGCQWIRRHADRKALERIFEHNGYVKDEVVYKKRV